MATRIPRKTAYIFGGANTAIPFGQLSIFGTYALGSVEYSSDLFEIQDEGNPTGAWAQGWQAGIVNGAKAPAMTDFNAILFTITQQISEIFQAGLPEYDAATVYFYGSRVQASANIVVGGNIVVAQGDEYRCINDNSGAGLVGVALNNPTFWQSVNADTINRIPIQQSVAAFLTGTWDGTTLVILQCSSSIKTVDTVGIGGHVFKVALDPLGLPVQIDPATGLPITNLNQFANSNYSVNITITQEPRGSGSTGTGHMVIPNPFNYADNGFEVNFQDVITKQDPGDGVVRRFSLTVVANAIVDGS